MRFTSLLPGTTRSLLAVEATVYTTFTTWLIELKQRKALIASLRGKNKVNIYRVT